MLKLVRLALAEKSRVSVLLLKLASISNIFFLLMLNVCATDSSIVVLPSWGLVLVKRIICFPLRSISYRSFRRFSIKGRLLLSLSLLGLKLKYSGKDFLVRSISPTDDNTCSLVSFLKIEGVRKVVSRSSRMIMINMDKKNIDKPAIERIKRPFAGSGLIGG